MFFTGDDVIQTAIADVVGPAVSAHNPEAAAAEHVFLLLQQWHQFFHDLVTASLWQQKVVHVLLLVAVHPTSSRLCRSSTCMARPCACRNRTLRCLRIGDDQSITKELSHELHVRSLTTPLTRSAEFQVRFLELRALHRGLVDLISTVWERDGKVPIRLLFLNDLLRRSQGQCISRANAHAQLAACAIPWRHLDAVLVVVQNTASNGSATAILESSRCLRQLLPSGQERSHCCVRANETALVALSALVHVNPGNIDGDTTLLILTRTTWHSATWHKGTHGKGIAIKVVARRLDLFRKLLGILQLWEHPWPLAVGDLLLKPMLQGYPPARCLRWRHPRHRCSSSPLCQPSCHTSF
eukprot:Skav206563  [mRNA]  locus=scaffold925:66341:69727:- [translate_table: standard]